MSEGTWLRFPLGLLAFEPGSSIKTLNAILDYCLWTVGASATANEITDEEADEYAREKGIKASKTVNHRRLVRGAKILQTIGGDCASMVATAEKVNEFTSNCGSAARNQVNISGELFWRAVDTARGDGKRPELSWQHFRFLCALLSKIGSRKFDRCGWQEIQARAAGWCGKADKRNATTPERIRRDPLILTEYQIRATREELEACNFFCRIKYRTGGPGNGGESWYSFSTKPGDDGRAELIDWITNKKHRMKAGIAEKRAKDVVLIAGTANSPRTNHQH